MFMMLNNTLTFTFSVSQLKFEDDLKITKMYSGEGEMVDFCETMYPTGNVEDWMLEIERVMKESLRQIIKESLGTYKSVRRLLPVDKQ
jgi:dynein heavy chain